MLEGKKVVLAYSGGLDTSVCVKWLEQQGAEPYALYLDLGQGEPPEDVKAKALQIGATDAFVRDAKAEFAGEYVPCDKSERAIRREVPTLHGPRAPTHSEEARRDCKGGWGDAHRARLDGEGQRSGTLRRDDSLHRSRPDRRRPGARLEHEPPRGDGLRRGARHPRPNDERVPLQRGREPLGPLYRGRATGRPRPRTHRGRLRARDLSRERPRRAAVRGDRLPRRTANGARWGRAAASRPHIRTWRRRRRKRRRPHRHGRGPPGRNKEPRDLRSPRSPRHHIRPPRTRDPDTHERCPPLQDDRRTALRRTYLRGPVVHPPQVRPRRLRRRDPEDRNRYRSPQALQGQQHHRRPQSPKGTLQRRPSHLRSQQHLRRGRSRRLYSPLGPLSPPVGKRQRRYRIQPGIITTLNPRSRLQSKTC